MPAPLLVPLILLGGATIALAAASAKKKGAGGDVTPASGRTYTLDANMPPAVRDQVLAALMTEQDPARLEAFAAAIGASYPLAAAALRTKAAMLRPPPIPQPTPPRVDPPPPPPSAVDWQTQLMSVPDPPRSDVVRQLMGQNDPNALEVYARSLEAQYPIAAWALRVREAALRGMAPPPPPPPISPAPPVPPSPTPTPPSPTPFEPGPPTPTPVGPAPNVQPPSPTPSLLGGLDPGMPLEMQKAVVGALTTETDPAKLQGFASAIQAQYPVAAGLLMAKAQALLLVHPVTPPAPQPTPVRPTPSPTPDPVPPIPTSGTYTVQSGDFPIKIAQKIVHDGSRWKELVAANPNKKRAADGNFATLLPGEVLKLPASWTSMPPLFDSKGPHAALPAPGGAHVTHP